MFNFRSDTVGSLLRPNYLKQARGAPRCRACFSDAEFKRIEDRAVNEAVDLQTRVGLDVISDGEFRRYAFFGHLPDSIEGFDKTGGWAIPFMMSRETRWYRPGRSSYRSCGASGTCVRRNLRTCALEPIVPPK